MPAYLTIENVGVCPPEGFTVLGVSMPDTRDKQGVIGQFGSGNKHGVAVCLRHDIAPIVFCGTLRLDFFTKPQTVADSKASTVGRVLRGGAFTYQSAHVRSASRALYGLEVSVVVELVSSRASHCLAAPRPDRR